MKNILLILALCFFGTQAKALQFYESFAYPPASGLGGQGGWVLSSGTNPVIQAGTLVTPGLMPAGEGNSVGFGGGTMEVRHALTNLLGGENPGKYFYSLAFKVAALGAMTTNGGFIAAFSQSVQTIAYGGLLYLRKDVLGNTNSYNIGVAKTSARIGFLLHPDWTFHREGDSFWLTSGSARIRIESSLPFRIEPAVWWPDMGVERATGRLILRVPAGTAVVRSAMTVVVE